MDPLRQSGQLKSALNKEEEKEKKKLAKLAETEQAKIFKSEANSKGKNTKILAHQSMPVMGDLKARSAAEILHMKSQIGRPLATDLFSPDVVVTLDNFKEWFEKAYAARNSILTQKCLDALTTQVPWIKFNEQKCTLELLDPAGWKPEGLVIEALQVLTAQKMSLELKITGFFKENKKEELAVFLQSFKEPLQWLVLVHDERIFWNEDDLAYFLKTLPRLLRLSIPSQGFTYVSLAKLQFQYPHLNVQNEKLTQIGNIEELHSEKEIEKLFILLKNDQLPMDIRSKLHGKVEASLLPCLLAEGETLLYAEKTAQIPRFIQWINEKFSSLIKIERDLRK